MNLDRVVGALKAIIKAEVPIDLYAFYPAEVVQQASDGTLELRSLDSRLPESLTKVPYRPGFPGVTFKVDKGAVCLVGFEGGSEEHPYVKSWVSGQPTELVITTTSKVTIVATTEVTIDAPSVLLAGTGGSHPVPFGDVVKSMLQTTWNTLVAGKPLGFAGVPVPFISDVGIAATMTPGSGSLHTQANTMNSSKTKTE